MSGGTPIPLRHIAPPPGEAGLSGNFTIRDIAAMLAGKDMVQELHRHDFYYLLALQKGGGTHAIDFTPYEVRDHVVFFMRPGQVHALTLQAGATGYLLAFQADMADGELLRKAAARNGYYFDAGGFSPLHSLLTGMFNEYSGKHPAYLKVIKATLSILFIQLIRQHDDAAAGTASHYRQERFTEFSSLLETHIATHKQVSAYAEMLHLSPYQLNAITKSVAGKTCSALIDEQIVLEAKRLLLATTAQVSQVAFHLGFDDASYFIRFFRKQTGFTPEAFRENYR